MLVVIVNKQKPAFLPCEDFRRPGNWKFPELFSLFFIVSIQIVLNLDVLNGIFSFGIKLTNPIFMQRIFLVPALQ